MVESCSNSSLLTLVGCNRDVRSLHDLFVKADVDRNHAVSRREWTDAMTALGFEVDEEDARVIWEKMDTDHSGGVRWPLVCWRSPQFANIAQQHQVDVSEFVRFWEAHDSAEARVAVAMQRDRLRRHLR